MLFCRHGAQNLGYDTYFTGKYLNQLRNVDPSTCPKCAFLWQVACRTHQQLAAAS